MNEQEIKILIIGGNSASVLLYERVITHRCSIRVLVSRVSNGEEGIQHAIEEKPDLIIIDNSLPHAESLDLEDNWLLSRELRKKLNPHIFAVVLAGFPKAIARTMENGDPSLEWFRWFDNPLNEMFKKPMLIDDFTKKVEGLLQALNRGRED